MGHMKRGNLFIGFSFIGLRKRSDYIFRKLEYILTFWGAQNFVSGWSSFFFNLNIVKIQFAFIGLGARIEDFHIHWVKFEIPGANKNFWFCDDEVNIFFHSNIV